MTSQFGGAWLLGETWPDDVFTPEDRNDEHRMISVTAQAFIEQEVIPRRDALEAKDWAVARQLMRQCGELGLLGVDVPEDFGGVGLDTVSSVLVSEAMGRHASFATTAAKAEQANSGRHRGAETLSWSRHIPVCHRSPRIAPYELEIPSCRASPVADERGARGSPRRRPPPSGQRPHQPTSRRSQGTA